MRVKQKHIFVVVNCMLGSDMEPVVFHTHAPLSFSSVISLKIQLLDVFQHLHGIFLFFSSQNMVHAVVTLP